ncbi:multiple inositol polyphosphate phosphatase 1-like [Apis florea]|uniref:multiple inositol polyphosphate phosphatase 1-like n=1 Tax=Apis florea TaxID=7463 RepID=UPI000252BB81|nr:multiple inositol polyphosphate phosphatase 1-like [Apis florea]
MPSVKIFAILIAIFCLENDLALSEYCYVDDRNPFLFFSTKTAYEHVHGTINDSKLPKCEPLQIWMILRHGTRNSGKHWIKKLKNDLPQIQRAIIENHDNGKLCEKDYNRLKEWDRYKPLQNKKAARLTKQGKQDMFFLGVRFKNYFPELFQPRSSNSLEKLYQFRSTKTQRTVASMENFIKGLFNNITFDNAKIVGVPQDTLLQYYKIYEPYLNETANTTEMWAESDELTQSDEYNQMMNNISERLGLPNNTTDEIFTQIEDVYTICLFESAWYINEKSPWCAPFTKEDIEWFQYRDDMYFYYLYGYGQQMRKDVGCPPLKDLFNHFSNLENGNKNEPKGIFYFTHSAALQLLLSTLGYAKDPEPLVHDTNIDKAKTRKWYTANLTPFAANLAAIFYKCDDGFKVKLYLNEKPLDYEGCPRGMCEWSHLKKILKNIAINCETDKSDEV